MKIIMRRVSEIFYSENLRNDNAVRRCLPDKTEAFYQVLVLEYHRNANNTTQNLFVRQQTTAPENVGFPERQILY